MREAIFEPTFDGWRDAARALLREEVAPHEIAWVERGAAQPLLDGLAVAATVAATLDANHRAAGDGRARVPRAFVERAARGLLP